MNRKIFATELHKRYGRITRARNCFLYTSKGVRITDLFQEDGRAILGWRGDSAFTILKNLITKGISGSYICEDFPQVKKSVNAVLGSDFNIYFFPSKTSALKQAIKISAENTAVWKPWLSDAPEFKNNDCVIMAPPLPWTDSVYILAVKTEINCDLSLESMDIPFPLQAAIARAFYNLIAETKVRQEKDWFIYDPILTKYFTRKGPYLYSKVPQDKYDDFVIHCLNLGIAINPDFNSPSIIPYGADRGIFTKLKNSPFIY